MSKLLAVIDGSAYSASVCEHAAWIANRAGSEVDVVHILGRRNASGESANLSGSIGLGARSSLLSELAELDAQKAKLAQQRGRAILEDAESLLKSRGVANTHSRLRHGEIVETVLELETDADLLVLGKRGEGANFDSGHLGSNLERVVRSSPKPVFVASRSFSPITRVLIAFDGGKSSLKAIEFFSQRKHYSDLICHVMMVGTDTAEHRRQVEGAVATLKNGGFEATGDILAGQPETVITDQVDNHDFNLVIMGAYGHSRIRNMIIGSTTTEMIRSCKVPVLLFR